jgi:hypothetical protein
LNTDLVATLLAATASSQYLAIIFATVSGVSLPDLDAASNAILALLVFIILPVNFNSFAEGPASPTIGTNSSAQIHTHDKIVLPIPSSHHLLFIVSLDSINSSNHSSILSNHHSCSDVFVLNTKSNA